MKKIKILSIVLFISLIAVGIAKDADDVSAENCEPGPKASTYFNQVVRGDSDMTSSENHNTCIYYGEGKNLSTTKNSDGTQKIYVRVSSSSVSTNEYKEYVNYVNDYSVGGPCWDNKTNSIRTGPNGATMCAGTAEDGSKYFTNSGLKEAGFTAPTQDDILVPSGEITGTWTSYDANTGMLCGSFDKEWTPPYGDSTYHVAFKVDLPLELGCDHYNTCVNSPGGAVSACGGSSTSENICEKTGKYEEVIGYNGNNANWCTNEIILDTVSIKGQITNTARVDVTFGAKEIFAGGGFEYTVTTSGTTNKAFCNKDGTNGYSCTAHQFKQTNCSAPTGYDSCTKTGESVSGDANGNRTQVCSWSCTYSYKTGEKTEDGKDIWDTATRSEKTTGTCEKIEASCISHVEGKARDLLNSCPGGSSGGTISVQAPDPNSDKSKNKVDATETKIGNDLSCGSGTYKVPLAKIEKNTAKIDYGDVEYDIDTTSNKYLNGGNKIYVPIKWGTQNLAPGEKDLIFDVHNVSNGCKLVGMSVSTDYCPIDVYNKLYDHGKLRSLYRPINMSNATTIFPQNRYDEGNYGSNWKPFMEEYIENNSLAKRQMTRNTPEYKINLNQVEISRIKADNKNKAGNLYTDLNHVDISGKDHYLSDLGISIQSGVNYNKLGYCEKDCWGREE